MHAWSLDGRCLSSAGGIHSRGERVSGLARPAAPVAKRAGHEAEGHGLVLVLVLGLAWVVREKSCWRACVHL